MQVRVSQNVQDLQGDGEEWLLASDAETVIAQFFDGNFIRHTPATGNQEETITL